MCTENKYFVPVEQIKQVLLQECGISVEQEWIDELCKVYILAVIKRQKCSYVYNEDIDVCKRLMLLNYKFSVQEIEKYEYYGKLTDKILKIAENTILLYEYSDTPRALPVFVRNIVRGVCDVGEEVCEPTMFEMLGVTILTTNKSVCRYIEGAAYRKHQLDCIKTSNFANSSAYMGSKKKMVGFIVEATFSHSSNESCFLDLMCGSGAVSNAFAQIGMVYASDAQEFCRILAKIQGGGYQERSAETFIRRMYEDYNEHLKIMKCMFANDLSEEERILYLDRKCGEDVYKQYSEFIDKFELYASDKPNSPELEYFIYARKKNPYKVPYCLFTYYFSNVFFGLSQCIQIDSIRYAIDQIKNKEIREWALGALIVAVSRIGTTHAGHFAQPKRLDVNTLQDILRQREKSVWHEFSKSFTALARESERYQYPVRTLDGPWENALISMKQFAQEDAIVYLDAPYKRDEYSRYYHVLETLVKYDYPSSENKGRMRSKQKGERFSTKFFTKNIQSIENYFVEIILKILEQGYICVWSYSDNAVASIVNVVTDIKDKSGCDVCFYSMPHNHNVQRKQATKISVIEYCVVFSVKK